MTEGTEDRAAVLRARIKELEDQDALSAQTLARGGMFAVLWQTVNKFVPPWLAALAVAAFLGNHAYKYYMDAQIGGAETELKRATSAYEAAMSRAQNQPTESGLSMQVETAKANLRNTEAEASRAKADADAAETRVGDETTSLATAKANLANTQAQASRAKADADAATARVDDESMALATAKANLENLQNQATLAKARADAASEQSGLKTLAQREAVAKLVVTDMQAVNSRIQASLSNSYGNLSAMIRDACNGTQFPDLLGCQTQQSPPPQPEGDSASASEGRVATVANAPQLTLRSCPSPSCDDLRHLPNGLHVLVTSQERSPWFGIKVQTDDGETLTGYVNGKYLTWGAK